MILDPFKGKRKGIQGYCVALLKRYFIQDLTEPISTCYNYIMIEIKKNTNNLSTNSNQTAFPSGSVFACFHPSANVSKNFLKYLKLKLHKDFCMISPEINFKILQM